MLLKRPVQLWHTAQTVPCELRCVINRAMDGTDLLNSLAASLLTLTVLAGMEPPVQAT